jgi:hypothetical protein
VATSGGNVNTFVGVTRTIRRSAVGSGGGCRPVHEPLVHLVQQYLLRVLVDPHGALDLDPAAVRGVQHEQGHPRVAHHVAGLHPALDRAEQHGVPVAAHEDDRGLRLAAGVDGGQRREWAPVEELTGAVVEPYGHRRSFLIFRPVRPALGM